MSSIKTYTGVMFDPVHPESERIDILDIAHALSMAPSHKNIQLTLCIKNDMIHTEIARRCDVMYYRTWLENPTRRVYTYYGETTNDLHHGIAYEITANGNGGAGIDVRYGPEDHKFIRYRSVTDFLQDWHPIYMQVLDKQVLKFYHA